MIPISFREQILPGTFEHTLSYLIDHELDLSIFDQRYDNDDTGRRKSAKNRDRKTGTDLFIPLEEYIL